MQLKIYAACGKPFNLGNPVVLAHANPDNSLTLIHENEAIYDKEEAAYFERSLFEHRQSG
jgi:hypothetical protein